MMDEELEAIVPNVPIVPLLLGLDESKVIEQDWDELDYVGLVAELGPFDLSDQIT